MTAIALSEWLTSFFERLQTGEDLEYEVKTALGGFPKSIWETVSAFANTCGGWILLGVKQVDNSFEVVGVPNAPALLDDFCSTLRNPSKINFAPCGAQDATIHESEGKHVLVIRVPEAPRQRRPVYIGNNPYEGTFVRRHSGDYRCTQQEVNRMMREASDDPLDATTLPMYGFSDIEPKTLASYRQRYQNLHPSDPQNDYDDKAFLTALGAYNRNRGTGDEGLTVAGLLMFGTEQAIREWRVRHLIDYRLVPKEDVSSNRWDDRITWEGNLFSGFYAIYPKLTQGLASAFQLQDATRVDESLMHIVLREALVNLLVHTDYTEREVSLIIRTPSGILFRNPGNSRVPIRELLSGDRSDPRNPALVRMFRRIGLAEEAGTGIPKIIRTWRELGLNMPDIESETERYEFLLQLRLAHLLMASDRQWLHGIGDNWTEEEQLALVHAKQHGFIDNSMLIRVTGKPRAETSRVLEGLFDRQFLDKVAGIRLSRYVLGKMALVPDMTIDSFGPVPAGISPELWKGLVSISAYVREQTRVNPHTLDDVIDHLCSQTPLSIDHLALLLSRKQRYLQEKVVSRLLATGKLYFLIPDKYNHPDQKYIAKNLLNLQR